MLPCISYRVPHRKYTIFNESLDIYTSISKLIIDSFHSKWRHDFWIYTIEYMKIIHGSWLVGIVKTISKENIPYFSTKQCIRLDDLCCLGSHFCILWTMAYFRRAGVDDTILETASRGSKHQCTSQNVFQIFSIWFWCIVAESCISPCNDFIKLELYFITNWYFAREGSLYFYKIFWLFCICG